MENERIERALEWAKERKLGSKQLNLFDRQYDKEREATKREKKLNKKSKNEEKFKAICQGIKGNKGNLDKEEFKQMCKEARVDQRSLAKTVFTESIESS